MKRSDLRPGVRVLLRSLEASVDLMGRPYWLLRTAGRAALITPTSNGTHTFMRGFHRSTVQEAVKLGLVRLGDVRQAVPQYAGGGKTWPWGGGFHEGRTIALTKAAGGGQ